MKALYSLLVAVLAAGAMGSASAADAPYVNAQTVRHAQKALNDRGFRTGGVDGHMGPQTEAALVNFQRAEKLQPTGKLDRKTLAALGMNSQEPGRAGDFRPLPACDHPQGPGDAERPRLQGGTGERNSRRLDQRGAAPVPEIREHRRDRTAEPAHPRPSRHRRLGFGGPHHKG